MSIRRFTGGKHLLLALMLAAILACAGCGDDSTSAETQPESAEPAHLSKAEFIEKGDAICRKTDRDQQRALDTYMKDHPKAQANRREQEKTAIAVALPPILTEAEELAALPAPKGDEREIEAIVTEIEKGVAKGKRSPRLLFSGNNSPFAKANELASAYGFVDCSFVF